MSALRLCPRCGAYPKMAHINIDRGTHAWAVHCVRLCGADTHWQLSATMAKEAVPVTGIHLVRLGDYVIVRAEMDGKWVDVIREHHDGSFSHIVEPLGMRRRQTTFDALSFIHFAIAQLALQN